MLSAQRKTLDRLAEAAHRTAALPDRVADDIGSWPEHSTTGRGG
ncbi:hypothetical protein [Haloplanus natans]|nr:hypothetical protein [Haloplanus natans]